MKYIPEFKKGSDKNWIQKAVNPKHKGYCTPMTKVTCTPKRKAFAETMKKHHGFHKKQEGGPVEKMIESPVAAKLGNKLTKHQIGGILDMNKKLGTYINSEKSTRALGINKPINSITPPNISKKFTVPTLVNVPKQILPLVTRPATVPPLIPKYTVTPNVVGLQKPQIQNPYGKAEINLTNGWPIISKQGENLQIGTINIPGLRSTDKWTTQPLTRNNWLTYANALNPETRTQVNAKYNIDTFLKSTQVQPTPIVGNDMRF